MLIDRTTYDQLQRSLYDSTANVDLRPSDHDHTYTSLMINGIHIDDFQTYTDALNFVVFMVNEY